MYRAVIDKLTAATNKQRNVSMEIKNCFRILNGLVDSIQCNRRATPRATSGPQRGVPLTTAQEPRENGERKRAREVTSRPASLPSPVGKKPKE